VIATKHPDAFFSLPFTCFALRVAWFDTSPEAGFPVLIAFCLERVTKSVFLIGIGSLFPLWTTFVHILDQQQGLSKGKFQQILQKEGVSRGGCKKYNLFGNNLG
jgi:hypothetical protein